MSFDPSKHARGGNPANTGQFSPMVRVEASVDADPAKDGDLVAAEIRNRLAMVGYPARHVYRTEPRDALALDGYPTLQEYEVVGRAARDMEMKMGEDRFKAAVHSLPLQPREMDRKTGDWHPSDAAAEAMKVEDEDNYRIIAAYGLRSGGGIVVREHYTDRENNPREHSETHTTIIEDEHRQDEQDRDPDFETIRSYSTDPGTELVRSDPSVLYVEQFDTGWGHGWQIVRQDQAEEAGIDLDAPDAYSNVRELARVEREEYAAWQRGDIHEMTRYNSDGEADGTEYFYGKPSTEGFNDTVRSLSGEFTEPNLLSWKG